MYQREIMLYTRGRSWRSWRLKRLLRRGGYNFEVVDIADDSAGRPELLKAVHLEVAMPYVFVDHRPAGGFGAIRALARAGNLARLLRDEL
jgi:glutaredoxin